MKFKLCCAAMLAAIMTVPAFAADEDTKKRKGKGKRGRAAGTFMVKAFDVVELTEEQATKAKELAKDAFGKIAEIRKKAGITHELTKKRAEAAKSMKDSGLKGQELNKAVNEKAGYTKEQAAALKESNQVRVKFQKEVVAMLTDEQKEKLPKAIARAVKPRGKGNRKKKDAA